MQFMNMSTVLILSCAVLIKSFSSTSHRQYSPPKSCYWQWWPLLNINRRLLCLSFQFPTSVAVCVPFVKSNTLGVETWCLWIINQVFFFLSLVCVCVCVHTQEDAKRPLPGQEEICFFSFFLFQCLFYLVRFWKIGWAVNFSVLTHYIVTVQIQLITV